MRQCKCKSYNHDVGSTPSVGLDPNEFFDWERAAQRVAVDACIADEIRALWRAGIWTRGCCCGHGGRAPSVVLDSAEDPQPAIDLLAEINPGRNWEVLQWQLVNCSSARSKREAEQARRSMRLAHESADASREAVTA